MTKPDETPFGKQFAETWALLQRYLGDLDAKELASMAKLDADETLDLLKQQPALGHAGALRKAKGKSPEELAVAIVKERLAVLTGKLPSGPEGTWGGRFLQQWRKLGGPISSFSYSRIQELKQANREQAIQMFGSNMGSYRMRQVFRECTPEEAALDLLGQHRVNALMLAAIIL